MDFSGLFEILQQISSSFCLTLSLSPCFNFCHEKNVNKLLPRSQLFDFYIIKRCSNVFCCIYILLYYPQHDGAGKRLNRDIHQYKSTKIGNKKIFWHEIIWNVVRSWEEWNGGGFNFRTFALSYLVHSTVPLNQFLLFFLGKIIL